MNSICQLHRHAPPPLPPSPSLRLSNRPPFFSKPISSLPRTTIPSPSLNLLCVKASAFISSPKPQFHKTLIRHSCIAITAAALLIANFTHRVLPSVASPIAPPPPAVDSVEQVTVDEENEKRLEAFVASNPDDVKGLQSLMECKVRSQKIDEALILLERLSVIEPENIEWLLLRANLYNLTEEFESARIAFEDVLKKDSLCVEAYHGIVMALSQSSSDEGEELKEMLKRIEKAMETCSKDDERKEDLRDFKLLLAQVKVFEGNYGDALKVYQELALEEPRDFRPYLCLGIVYTLLRREEEAKVYFDKYRKLVPEGHPYGRYLEENMFRSMGMSQGIDNKTTTEKRLMS